ncbi:MAG: helix-turn-helix domain-containing protein [Erysipelotrichaceae bacterium]|nr:helix-turn-helix domain-containing protein [Erysipelotrichaceae bacterium]
MRKEQVENKNISIYLNLEDTLVITHNEEKSVLKVNDIVIVNPHSKVTLEGDNALFVRFEVDLDVMDSIFSKKRFRFFCDSTVDKNDNYALLFEHLTKYLQYYYENQTYRNALLAKQGYEIVIFIVSNFSLGEIASDKGDITQQLIDYIDQNYQRELSLKQISADFFMTPQYFSKFFKESVGSTYYKYLSSIRLEHAMKALLTTDANLHHVALDNGFPNAESFYRCFQEAYQTTPQEYRKIHQLKQEEKKIKQKEAYVDILEYLGKNGESQPSTTEVLEIDCQNRVKNNRYWAKLVNVDSFKTLRDNQVREQLTELQSAMNYEYARISFDSSDIEDDIDFLRNLGMGMWFVIELRDIKDINEFCANLRKMLSYACNRYSVDKVRLWNFELCYNTAYDDDKLKLYWDTYERIQRVLDRFGCKRLMGASLSLANTHSIDKFYEGQCKDKVDYAIQTFQSEPYAFLYNEDELTVSRATDSSYLKNRILLLQQNHSEFSVEGNKPYITGWSDSLLVNSILNDSCFRGAEVVKNVIDCMGYVQALAPKMPLDLMSKTPSHGKVLFGADGLISKNGIKKPTFYSYAFLNHVGEEYLGKGKHSVVFGSKFNYQIICHNCKRLSYRYYLDEQHLDIKKYNEYFDELEPIHLTYHLNGAKDGEYIVKIRVMSTDSGSVQDVLLRTLEEEDIYIHPNDIHYFQQISAPKLRLERLLVKNGHAEFSIDLPANAFAHVHIIYQF